MNIAEADNARSGNCGENIITKILPNPANKNNIDNTMSLRSINLILNKINKIDNNHKGNITLSALGNNKVKNRVIFSMAVAFRQFAHSFSF